MAFVLFLLFLIIVLAMAANSSGQKAYMIKQAKKEYPPCKFQEEYLLACKYYQEYLRDGSRLDPKGDAIYQASADIWMQGYLPTGLQSSGMSTFHDRRSNLRTEPFNFYRISTIPDHTTLMRLRKEDESIVGLKGKQYYSEDFFSGRSTPEWNAYIAKIERLYQQVYYGDKNLKRAMGKTSTSEEPYILIDDSSRSIFNELKQHVHEEAASLTIAEFAEKYKGTIYWQYRIYCKDYH